MFKLVLEKAEEPEIKLPTSIESSQKEESSRKTSTSALLTMPKPLTVWIATNYGKFLKKWEYQSSLLRNLYAGQEATVRTGHVTQTGSKLVNEYYKDVYFQPAFLTFIQSTSCEMLDWMNHKLGSRLLGEISISSDRKLTPPQ